MADETNTQTTTTDQQVDPVQSTTSTTTDPVVTHGETTTTATDGKTQEELEAENAANQTAPSDAVIADTHTEDGSAVVQPVDQVDPVDEYDELPLAQPTSPEQQAAEQHAEQVALDAAAAEQDRIVEVHNQDVDGVAIPNEEHARAKELYASLLTGDLPEDSKVSLRELGILLDLNSQASAKADSTGDYAAGDIHA